MLDERIHQLPGSETHYIGGWQARFILCLFHSIACFLFTETMGYQCKANDFAWLLGAYPTDGIFISCIMRLNEGSGQYVYPSIAVAPALWQKIIASGMEP